MKRLAPTILFFILGCSAAADAAEWKTADKEAMRKAAAAYAETWLSNDDEIMATFVAEPVLSPSGLAYREGQAATRQFWFPEYAPPTKVTSFELQELESDGSGDLGFARGTFVLAFDYDGESYVNHGKYVSLMRRQPGGQWLITHHIWDDFPRTE